jgi:hypothetical protein
MLIVTYVVVGLVSFWTSFLCIRALLTNAPQKTGTMPDNDILIKLLFGKSNVPMVNNAKGAILWFIGGIICLVLLLRAINWYPS